MHLNHLIEKIRVQSRLLGACLVPLRKKNVFYKKRQFHLLAAICYELQGVTHALAT